MATDKIKLLTDTSLKGLQKTIDDFINTEPSFASVINVSFSSISVGIVNIFNAAIAYRVSDPPGKEEGIGRGN